MEISFFHYILSSHTPLADRKRPDAGIGQENDCILTFEPIQPVLMEPATRTYLQPVLESKSNQRRVPKDQD